MRPCEAGGNSVVCSGSRCKNTIYGDITGQRIFHYPQSMFWKKNADTGKYEATSDLPHIPTGYKATVVANGVQKGISWCSPNFYPTEYNNNPGPCPLARELRVSDLYWNACATEGNFAGAFPDFQRREIFCNSITDMAGNKRVPKICGGDDPDVYFFDPSQAAVELIQDDVKSAADKAAAETAAKVKRSRGIAIVLALLLILLIFLIFA